MVVNIFFFKWKLWSSGSRLAGAFFSTPDVIWQYRTLSRARLEARFPAVTCLYNLLFLSVVNTDGLLAGLKSPACSQIQLLALVESNPRVDTEGRKTSSEPHKICGCRQSGICCERTIEDDGALNVLKTLMVSCFITKYEATYYH